MTRLQFATDASPGGALVSDDSNRANGLSYATNEHGFAELRSSVPMALAEAFLRYDRAGLPHARLNDGPGAVYEGRIEDVAITGDGISMTALGYSRALSDAPYTALWSSTSVADWEPITSSDITTRNPERYQMDTNNRLFLAPQKNATYANTGQIGEFHLTGPNGGSRKIVGLSFDYDMIMPANWQLIASSWTLSWARTNLFTLNATGALQTGSVLLLPPTIALGSRSFTMRQQRSMPARPARTMRASPMSAS